MTTHTRPLHLTGPWRKSTKSASGSCVETAPAEWHGQPEDATLNVGNTYSGNYGQ